MLTEFPNPAEHLPQSQTLPTYNQGWLPLTNAAAVFAALATLPEDSPCQVRPLRVSAPWVTRWDPAPVAALGTPGSTQTREGMPGVAWPIYSRDMPIARGCLSFIVALAAGKPTPVLAAPKQTSGLWAALLMGVVPLESVGQVDVHGALIGATAAQIWVQRQDPSLADGEPQHFPPTPITVDCSVPLSQVVAEPRLHLQIPDEFEGLRECIVERLTKLRVRGRPAGTKPSRTPAAAALEDMRQRAERAELEVRRLQDSAAAAATLYAEQLATLPIAEPGVPVAQVAGYIAQMLDYLRPDAPFNDLAAKINAEQPALFAAIAKRLHGG